MRLLLLVGFSLLVLTNCQYDGESNRIDAAETFAKSPASKISGDANELKAQESVEIPDLDGPPTYARPETAPGVPEEEEDSDSEDINENLKAAGEPETTAEAVSKPATSEAAPITSKTILRGYPIPPVSDSLEDSPITELNRGDDSQVKSVIVASPSAPTSTELKNTPIRPYSSEVSTEGSGSSESSESSSSSSESVEEGSGAEAKTHDHQPSPPEYVRPSNAPGVPKVEKSKPAQETTVTQASPATTTKPESKAPQTLVPSNPKAVEKAINNATTTVEPATEAEVKIEGSGEAVSTSEAPLTKSEDSASATEAEQPHLGAGAYDEGAQLLDQIKLDDNSTETNLAVVESSTAEVLTTLSEILAPTNSTEPIVSNSTKPIISTSTEANVSTSPSYDADSVIQTAETVDPESSSTPALAASVSVKSSGVEPKVAAILSSTVSTTLEPTTSSSETSPSPPEPTSEPTGVTEAKEPGYEPEPPSVQPEAAAEVEASGEVIDSTTTEATVTQQTTVAHQASESTTMEVTTTEEVKVTPESSSEATVANTTTSIIETTTAQETTVALDVTVTPEPTTIQDATVSQEGTVTQEKTEPSSTANPEITEALLAEGNVSITPGYSEEALAEILVSPDEENKQVISTEAPAASTDGLPSSEASSTSPETSTQPIVEVTTTMENIETTEVIEPESESVANFSETPAPEDSTTPGTPEVTETTISPSEGIQTETSTIAVPESTPVPSPEVLSSAPPSYSDVDEITSPTQETTSEASINTEALPSESIEPSEPEAAVGYAGISNEVRNADQSGKQDSFANSNNVEIIEKNTERTPITSTLNANPRKWTPYMFDCTKEIDEKGALCKEWAEGGLCEINKPTMFLFCRRTCLCTGPQ